MSTQSLERDCFGSLSIFGKRGSPQRFERGTHHHQYCTQNAPMPNLVIDTCQPRLGFVKAADLDLRHRLLVRPSPSGTNCVQLNSPPKKSFADAKRFAPPRTNTRCSTLSPFKCMRISASFRPCSSVIKAQALCLAIRARSNGKHHNYLNLRPLGSAANSSVEKPPFTCYRMTFHAFMNC